MPAASGAGGPTSVAGSSGLDPVVVRWVRWLRRVVGRLGRGRRGGGRGRGGRRRFRRRRGRDRRGWRRRRPAGGPLRGRCDGAGASTVVIGSRRWSSAGLHWSTGIVRDRRRGRVLGVDGIRNRVAITAAAADRPPMLTSMAGLRPSVDRPAGVRGGPTGAADRSGQGRPRGSAGAGGARHRSPRCGSRGHPERRPGCRGARAAGRVPGLGRRRTTGSHRSRRRAGIPGASTVGIRAWAAPVAVTPAGCSDSAAPLAIAFFGSASTATGRPSCSETSSDDQRDPRRATDQQHRRELVRVPARPS